MGDSTFKNIKISEYHHKILKEYCEVNGLKIHKVIQKCIEDVCKNNAKPIQQKKDIYGDWIISYEYEYFDLPIVLIVTPEIMFGNKTLL